MVKRRFIENGFVLFYLAAAIASLTLSPFDFQPYVPSENWVWRISFEDFARNVLLFFPFGLVLRQTVVKHPLQVLMGGFLLSLSIEMAQLFIELRTSNFVDLISNSVGALTGALFFQWAFAGRFAYSFRLALACMFVPLCWVSAIRSLWDPAATMTVLLSAIASLLLIQPVLPPYPKKLLFLGSWVGLTLLPLLDTSPLIGSLFILATPGILALCARFNRFNHPRIILEIALASLVLIFWINGVWYVTEWRGVWTNNAYLRVSESCCGVALVLANLWWNRQTYSAAL